MIRTFLRGGADPFIWIWRHIRGVIALLGFALLWLTPIGIVMHLFPPTIITVPIAAVLFYGGLLFGIAGAFKVLSDRR